VNQQQPQYPAVRHRHARLHHASCRLGPTNKHDPWNYRRRSARISRRPGDAELSPRDVAAEVVGMQKTAATSVPGTDCRTGTGLAGLDAA